MILLFLNAIVLLLRELFGSMWGFCYPNGILQIPLHS
jgi:hypothetical protein